MVPQGPRFEPGLTHDACYILSPLLLNEVKSFLARSIAPSGEIVLTLSCLLGDLRSKVAVLGLLLLKLLAGGILTLCAAVAMHVMRSRRNVPHRVTSFK